MPKCGFWFGRHYVRGKVMTPYSLIYRLLLLACVVGFSLATCQTAWSATYYVSIESGNDGGNGLSPSNAWKTIAKVNRSRFNPGDRILFKCGETWRERLTVSSSGSSTAPITYGSYKTGPKPEINGSVVVKSWLRENVPGKTLYSASQDTDGQALSRPDQVFRNDNRLVPSTKAIADMGNNQWKWENQKLYVNIGGDPSGSLVEASSSARYSCIVVGAKKFITLENITIQKANQDGLLITNGSSHINLSHMTASNNYWAGINVWDESAKQPSGSVEGSSIEGNGGNGIHFSNVQQWKISNNEVHGNCRLKESPNHQHTAGIKLNGLNSIGNIVEHNTVSGSARGCGIWLDFCGRNNIIRYNNVFDNYSAGIMNEITSGTRIYYNKSNYNGRSYNYEKSQCTAAGIFIWGRTGLPPQNGPANDNVIYNNLCYANLFKGIIVQGDGKSGGIIDRNKVMNNVSVENQTQFCAGGGAEKTNARNIITHNCFGNEARRLIEWGWGRYKSTYKDWETAYGSNTYSIKASPLFVDAANEDFGLQNNSPCINAGSNVGLTRDLSGKILSGNPDVGPYEWLDTRYYPPKKLEVK
jgi:hypothetical protein